MQLQPPADTLVCIDSSRLLLQLRLARSRGASVLLACWRVLGVEWWLPWVHARGSCACSPESQCPGVEKACNTGHRVQKVTKKQAQIKDMEPSW